VTFQVDGVTYALPLEQVREVVRMVAVTPLPAAPAWVVGAVNLRGTLVPMIDVRALMSGRPADIDPSQMFVVAHASGQMLALVADEVEDIVQISPATVQVSEDAESGAVVRGLAGSAEGSLVILDVTALLERAEVGKLAPAVVSSVADRMEEGGGSAVDESVV
jgi:purine-binding chemotaxis protein CheW